VSAGKTFRGFWSDWQWLFVALTGAVALVLGVVGSRHFLACQSPGQAPPGLLEALYLTLQLFTLNATVNLTPESWSLSMEIARFLAPAVTAWALAAAALELFREQAARLRLYLACRFSRAGHTVVCGIGRKGFELVKDCRSRGETAVAVDWDAENDFLETCRELGAHVVIGDARDETTLKKAHLRRASLLVCLCREDGTNAEVAKTAGAMPGGRPSRLRIGLHIQDLGLCGALRAGGLFAAGPGQVPCRVFNVYESAARRLLAEDPLDWVSPGPSDPRAVHLVVVGFGRMGESLAVQAAKLGHFANGVRLRVTVVDRGADEARRRLFAHHPLIDKACDVSFLPQEGEDPAFLNDFAEWAADGRQIASAAVCFDDDGRNLACSIRLREACRARGVPLRVRANRQGGLADLARRGPARPAGEGDPVRIFSVVDRNCTRDEILNLSLDRLASVIHEEYRGRNPAAGYPPWEHLDEETRDFNRQQADHIEVKLRAIGCRSVPGTGGEPFAFRADEVEVLARLEHTRWMAAQSMAGYRPGRTETGRKDKVRRIHPMIVPWEELSEEQKDNDRNPVRNIPALLAKVGRRVERKSP
jgi:voltage-gated potassium channel Kch